MNYLVGGIIPDDFDSNKKKKFLHDCRFYLWDDLFLYKKGINGMVQRCVRRKNKGASSKHVMTQNMEDILVAIEQQQKSSSLGCTGIYYSRMLKV